MVRASGTENLLAYLFRNNQRGNHAESLAGYSCGNSKPLGDQDANRESGREIQQGFRLLQPRLIGEVNDFHVKAVKLKGEFLWHTMKRKTNSF